MWSATGLQIAGRVFSSACALATLAILSRHLERGEFGRYTFYLAAFALLDALADFGSGQVAIQQSAAQPERLGPVLGAARRARLATGSFGVVLVTLLLVAYREPGSGWIFAASLYPLTHAFELSATVFKNRISWGVPVLARTVASTLRVLVVIALWYGGVTSAAVFLFGTAVASSSANVLLHLLSRRHLPPGPYPTFLLSALFARAAPLGLAALCQQAYFNVDNLFVRAIEGEDQLGLYNGAVRFLSFLIMAAQVATAAALPWFTRRSDAGQLGPAVTRLAQPSFAVAGLGLGVLYPWCGEVLELLLGDGFGQAAASLRWLLGAAAMVYLGAPFLTALVAAGHTRAVLAVAASALALNVVGNAALVPARGIEGAAAATLATEAWVAVGCAVLLVRRNELDLAQRPLGWLGGPLAFALGLGLSSLLPIAS